LFPWMAYVLLGAGLGQIYARWGAAHLGTYANAVLLAPGAALLAGGLALAGLPLSLFGAGPFSWLPPQVMVRMGSCLVGLAVIAHASGRIGRLPHVFGAVAQETLIIYFVHLCIVYGSAWNIGLAQRYGPTFSPIQTVITVLLVMTAMVALAFYWNRWKHVRPRTARWMSVATGIWLVSQLI
jgi:hypothetical protein